LAISIIGVISPLKTIPNNSQLIQNIQQIIDQHQIEKIYVGISYGSFARKTHKFINQLRQNISLPLETVEETASTLEAESIFRQNQKKIKNLSAQIDSLAAAVILRRVLL